MDKYGSWTVLREYKGKNNRGRFEVQCDCGRLSDVDKYQILSGRSKMCKSCSAKKAKPSMASDQPAAKSVYIDYKWKAGDRGLAFDLTFEEFLAITKQSCYYCNREPSNAMKGKKENHLPFIFSGIDRIVNTEGYRMDNVVPSCKECNYAKRNMGVNEFYQWACRIMMNFDKLAELAEDYDENFEPFMIPLDSGD